MAGAHVLAGFGGQTRFAGNTSPGPEPPTAAPTSPSELVQAAEVLPSSLDHLLSGGFQPEHMFAAASRAVEQATDSVRRPEGGLAPRAGSNLQAGPAGAAVAARAQSFLSRIRGRG